MQKWRQFDSLLKDCKDFSMFRWLHLVFSAIWAAQLASDGSEFNSVPIKTTIQGVHSLLYENKRHDFIVALELPENYQNTIQLPHTFLFPTDN